MQPHSRATLARQEQNISGWEDQTSPCGRAALCILGIVALLLHIAILGAHP
ncbi:hypothetical protein [Mesorhizobium sp. L-8-3]|uniref:hypothetical protein n=1 Tax=Mesorhizobium sp. L-8-3 TaxID=2744522 RepID=UPI0019372B84|nr:hypothetical protein [Mesorhizobium sp. L-8-3]BCH27916.1 hypothetical protein MesoLjLb_77010 [Mesorhizobium sp. L-8-3]